MIDEGKIDARFLNLRRAHVLGRRFIIVTLVERKSGYAVFIERLPSKSVFNDLHRLSFDNKEFAGDRSIPGFYDYFADPLAGSVGRMKSRIRRSHKVLLIEAIDYRRRPRTGRTVLETAVYWRTTAAGQAGLTIIAVACPANLTSTAPVPTHAFVARQAVNENASSTCALALITICFWIPPLLRQISAKSLTP